MSGPWEKYQSATQDPWEKHSGPAEESFSDKVGKLGNSAADMGEAAANGAANGALFGYLPQVAGAVNALPSAFSGDYGDEYQRQRDKMSAYEQGLQQSHPYAYGAGTLAGALAVPIPGATEIGAIKGFGGVAKTAEAIKGLGAGGKVALAAGKGALIGGLSNPGDTQGQVDPLQIDQRLHNAKWGGIIGGAGDALAQGIEKTPETIDSIRRWMAAKQLGANTSQLKGLIRELPEVADRGVPEATRLDQLEGYMDKNKMLDMGTTYSGVVDKSGQLMNQEGQNIGGIYQGVQSKLDANPNLAQDISDTALHGPDLANEFLAQEQQRLAKVHGGSTALKQIEAQVGNPENPIGLTALGGNASLEDVHNYRMSVDDQIPWNADTTGKLVAQSNKRLRTFLNDKMQDRVGAVDEALGENSLPALKQANQSYSDAATVNKIAQNTKAREMAKFVPGLIGAVGGYEYGKMRHQEGADLLKSLAEGTAVGMGIRGARAVAPAITYRGATALEPLAQGAANYLGRNPDAGVKGAVIPWMLMNQENNK